jgi:hypothetical protein
MTFFYLTSEQEKIAITIWEKVKKHFSLADDISDDHNVKNFKVLDRGPYMHLRKDSVMVDGYLNIEELEALVKILKKFEELEKQ